MTTTTATTATTPATTTPSTTGGTALSQLSGNLNDFLNLLMTQLQNQDPTSPMDTNTFTTQLVQFSSVEQQINTNSNLNTLIQATQSNTLLQSSALVGKSVTATSDHLALQNGASTIGFTASTPQAVDVSVFSAAGTKIAEASVPATTGANTWSWNGAGINGQQPDGSYKVVVTAADGTTLPTTVTGTATSVQRNGTTMTVQLGALGIDFGTVQSVGQ